MLQDVTTHSNPLRFLLTAEKMRMFAGDCEPSPDIYNLAAETLGVSQARCVVIEDSKIGLAAGMRWLNPAPGRTMQEEVCEEDPGADECRVYED